MDSLGTIDFSATHVTVSGSFRKAMSEVQSAVEWFTDAGALVLSPADPRIVDSFGDFVFVASDQVRRLRTVQARHLASVAASDLLWLVAPEGYVGQSAAMEIGYAAAHQVPIFCTEVPIDLTLRQWVITVASQAEALRWLHEPQPQPDMSKASVLLDPLSSIQDSHDDLDVVQRGLTQSPNQQQTLASEAAMLRVRERLLLP